MDFITFTIAFFSITWPLYLAAFGIIGAIILANLVIVVVWDLVNQYRNWR